MAQPPCCFSFDDSSLTNASTPVFMWSPPTNENHIDNVNKVRMCLFALPSQLATFAPKLYSLVQVLKFLQQHVLPEGVFAVALQNVEWLTACIDCRGGTVTVANSKTDYAFLLGSGNTMLTQLRRESGGVGGVTADQLRLLLPHIIALFETKTTGSLGTGEGPMHQAVLEYLAVNKLRAATSGELACRYGGGPRQQTISTISFHGKPMKIVCLWPIVCG